MHHPVDPAAAAGSETNPALVVVEDAVQATQASTPYYHPKTKTRSAPTGCSAASVQPLLLASDLVQATEAALSSEARAAASATKETEGLFVMSETAEMTWKSPWMETKQTEVV